MPNRGDLVFYNSGDMTQSLWCVGQVLQTDTDPSSEDVTNALNEFDNSPSCPPTGYIYIGYWERNGCTESYPNTAVAAEGTGPGQYSVTNPGA